MQAANTEVYDPFFAHLLEGIVGQMKGNNGLDV